MTTLANLTSSIRMIINLGEYEDPEVQQQGRIQGGCQEPPNFIMREKLYARKCHILELNSYLDPPPLSEILYQPLGNIACQLKVVAGRWGSLAVLSCSDGSWSPRVSPFMCSPWAPNHHVPILFIFYFLLSL